MSKNHTGRDEEGRQGWSATDSRRWRKIIGAQLPLPCINPRLCGGALVYPDQAWDVGHVGGALKAGQKTPDDLGPAHRRCNRSDGGIEGAQKTNARKGIKAKDERIAKW